MSRSRWLYRTKMLTEAFAYVYATQKQGMWIVRQYKANVEILMENSFALDS